MISNILVWLSCSLLLTETEAFFDSLRKRKDYEDYPSHSTSFLSRPSNSLFTSFSTTYITAPLTTAQCRSVQFQNLRACRLNRTLLSALARPHMCQSRDGFHTNSVPIPTIRRKKRYLKPCSGTKQRVAVLQARDETGILRELVTDPGNYLYQTIIVENCPKSSTSHFGLRCRQHPITFLAAVFPTDPHSNAISVAYVSTPAFCALSF